MSTPILIDLLQTSRHHPDISYLHLKAQQYYNNGPAPTTRSTYATGQQRYTAFCRLINVLPTPATERILMLFATHLTTTNISYAIIKVYLSAIRQLHVTQGPLQYFNQQLTPRLQQTLKGIQKTQTATNPPRPRLPITVDIMQDIKHLLLHKPWSYTNTMIWAACSLAYFGFLRVSEFTIQAQDQYDQSCHPLFNDVSLR